MNAYERRKQIIKRVMTAVAGVLIFAAGMAAGIIIDRDSEAKATSAPDLSVISMTDFVIPDTEINELIYENYWNFIPMSYIVIGSDRETCSLYKISSNVPRHDYDLESFATNEDGYMEYNTDEHTSVLGMDISRFQGTIDWETVANESDIEFVMLRIGYRGYSEGGLVLDDTYVENVTAASEYGFDIGVYFFSQAISYEEGVEEAQFVLENLGDVDISYPIVIDTEQMETDARANDISNADRTAAIIGFCETIREAGYHPMIYANRNWYATSLDMDQLGSYDLWLAHYSNVPDFPYVFRIWQYTESGYVPGVSGDVDLDILIR